jgi:beta-lactamase regulating signal transducer with metallopeptidase domain
MNALVLWLVSYLANALWMVPLVFAAAWAAARLAQRLGPKPVHRIWVAALIAETLLPAVHLHSFNGEILRIFGLSEIASPAHGRATIALSALAGAREGTLIFSHDVLAAIAAIYGVVLVYFAMRFAYGLWKTHRIAMRANALCEDRVESRWRTVTAAFSVDAGIAESAEIPGPVTVGIRRQLLLLPRGFASHTAEDLDAVMAHECAHMARHDFLKNMFYSLFSLPCAFHPFLWLTRSRLSESREMVCDAIAAERLEGPQTYARSLLRLASALRCQPPGEENYDPYDQKVPLRRSAASRDVRRLCCDWIWNMRFSTHAKDRDRHTCEWADRKREANRKGDRPSKHACAHQQQDARISC